MSKNYGSWSLADLKSELRKRNAKLTGKKAVLIQRLQDYDKMFGGIINDPETAYKIKVPEPQHFLDISSDTNLPNITKTGEPKKKVAETQKVTLTDYDKLVDLFYKRLAEQRQYNQEMKEQDRRWSMQKVVRRFPGWNEVTIANLHSLFLLFDNQTNGMLGFDDFGAVLESLSDDSSMELRKEKFNAADTDNDGWITYDEFLSLVYNFSPQEEGQLTGLARLCNEVAENIQFVSNLTVGEQLEYGLF